MIDTLVLKLWNRLSQGPSKRETIGDSFYLSLFFSKDPDYLPTDKKYNHREDKKRDYVEK